MKLLVNNIILLLAVCSCHSANLDWDIAVAIEDKIEFLNKNATVVGITYQFFKNLKGIAFDNSRREFIISDMIDTEDSIYKMKLSNTKHAVPIVENIPDDVKGLAVDPVDDILYWVDSLHKRIMKISLNSTEIKQEVLLQFKVEEPIGIAVDSCRRKLYWTNANHEKPTIERANLDGTQREIIVEGNMFKPSGIVVDQATKSIYWADMGEGIYFRIERADLNGTFRKILYEDTHQTPFGIAVSDTSLYWTDLNNYALWTMKKDDTGLKPELVRQFNEKPMGIIIKNTDYKNLIECHKVQEAIDSIGSTSEEMILPASSSDYCLNSAELTPYGCKCNRGFTGPRCEINLCHNLCINGGSCYQSSQGYPKCKCKLGFIGERCEYEQCKNYCLNGGSCSVTLLNITQPLCKCPEGFSGPRCQTVNNPDKLCNCDNGDVIILGQKPYCRCGGNKSDSIAVAPLESSMKSQSALSSYITDPFVMCLMFGIILLLIILASLSMIVHKLRLRRPTIKKRIIVNKNVTPLTCRPNHQPQEQCEITIENCCNMNICETPCIQSPTIRAFQRNKTEEKKTLLTSMENGEDLY